VERNKGTVNKDSKGSADSLYRSVRLLRYILPIAAFLFVVVHQSLTHAWFPSPQWSPHFFWQVLPYGTIGPVVVWFALTWFARWVRERDEAETHLRCLNEISRQAANATEMETIVDIALHMPEEVISPVATSLVLRENPDGAWYMAGTCGLREEEKEMLATRLNSGGSELHCGQCTSLSATMRQNCPLWILLPQAEMAPNITAVVCLPLSTERPPLALLNVYLFDAHSLSNGMRRVLESMAAVLSVALDHARLRSSEIQMLHRMEQASGQREDLAVTMEQILGDVAGVQRARAGEVFVVSKSDQDPTLISLAAWAKNSTYPHLISIAQRALLEEDSIMATNPQHEGYEVAIPLMAEGLTTGVLVLASQHSFTASQQAFLRVAASMMALIIRNSQLYTKVERQAVLEERNRLAREFHDGLAQGLGFLNFKMQQVERLLAREQWETAQESLAEMREGARDLYAEVRQTIHNLRWFPEDGKGLNERLHQYVLDFSHRTGLDVSLDVKDEPKLSPQDEVHLFRIVQEALVNVYKHSQAEQAWVRLHVGPEATILEIEDDGAGIRWEGFSHDDAPSDTSEHLGLRIMQERAEAMGGQLSLDSAPGRGTRLRVTLGAPNTVDPFAVGATYEGR
jgi:signal transduction histidine kinase